MRGLQAQPKHVSEHYHHYLQTITVIFLQNPTVCNRTLQVSDVITATVPGIDDCRNVSDVHLAMITTLDLRLQSITSLHSGDLAGLLSLTSLNLSDNQLSSLPEGIFSDLRTLTTLNLSGNTVDPITHSCNDSKSRNGSIQSDRSDCCTFHNDAANCCL